MKLAPRVLAVILTAGCLLAQEDRIEWLKRRACPTTPSSGGAAAGWDFSCLKKSLAGAEIVALGEQSHGDGATIAAKIELIKFLHEELGFNIVAFESSMLDCDRENREFLEGRKSAAQAIGASVFPVWTRSRQFRELVSYLSAQKESGDPLRFAGFGAQPLPISPAEERFKPVAGALEELGLAADKESRPYLYNLFFDPRSFFARKPGKAEQEKIIEALKETGRTLLQKGATDESRVIGKSLEGTADLFYMFWNADLRNPRNTPGILNIRDRLMGEFVIFLKDRIYPREKVILWGANSHLDYNRDKIVEGSELKMVPAGHFVKERFGDKYYSVSFTSYEGKTGTPGQEASEVPPAPEGSIEALLAKAEFRSCFLDLRGIGDSQWLSQPLYGRFYGHGDFKAPWPELMDGLFFIREMTPSQSIVE